MQVAELCVFLRPQSELCVNYVRMTGCVNCKTSSSSHPCKLLLLFTIAQWKRRAEAVKCIAKQSALSLCNSCSDINTIQTGSIINSLKQCFAGKCGCGALWSILWCCRAVSVFNYILSFFFASLYIVSLALLVFS